MRSITLSAALALLTLGGAAHAKDAKPCAPDLICASRPASVVAALQEAGYKAKLDTDNEGDPSIETATNGYSIDVLFYGCENHVACDSLQFRLTLKKDARLTAERLNDWNRRFRFFQASLMANGEVRFCYDLSTFGGLNKSNMADVMAWVDSLSGAIDKFTSEKPGG